MANHSTLFRAALAAATVLLSTAAIADDCPRMLAFVCAAAEKAGERAAQKVADGMVGSADKLYASINFWPWLIQKYHTGTDEEKKQARELVKKVFGVDTIEGVKPFEVTLSFEGVSATKETPLDVILLRDYAKPDLKEKILIANTPDFGIRSLAGVVPPAKDDYEQYLADVASVRERVAKAALAVVSGGHAGYSGITYQVPQGGISSSSKTVTVCTDITDAGGEATYTPPAVFGSASPTKCKNSVAWKGANKAVRDLTEAIMLTVDPKIDKRASRLKSTYAYEGYKYLTLVFPKEQLEKQPNLKVIVNIHVKDKPDTSIPVFAGSVWSATQATIINQNPTAFDSKRKEHQGKYYAYTMNLGVGQ